MSPRTLRSWRILPLLAAGLVWGGPVQAATLYFAHTDAQGSVVAVTDIQRNVVERREYEPYGLPRQPVTDDPGYTGHVHDADSGLVYMQQRYYDPEVGRFLSVDPVGVSAATGANFNRYWYANNNPYTFVDPDGMFPGFPGDGNTDCSTFVVCPGLPQSPRFDADGGEGGSESGHGGLTGRQAEAFKALRSAAESTLDDIEGAIIAAYAVDDYAGATELRNLWFALVSATVSFSNRTEYAFTTAVLEPSGGGWRVLSLHIDFNASHVIHMYLHGAAAPEAGGYFLDYPSGVDGLKYLLIHEGRHGTVEGFIDSTGVRRSREARENDADRFIQRVYQW